MPESSTSSEDYSRSKTSKNSNTVINEVTKLMKENPHHISTSAMYKLRERYGDQELLDQIQDTFIERSREVRKRAKKFAKKINEKYGGQNYPLHILLKKALKYKKKLNLSDPEFEEFRRVYEYTLTGNEEPQHVKVTVPYTNMSRALGQGLVDVEDGMKFDNKDYESLQHILRGYAETKSTHAQVVLQSMSYRDVATEALTGRYSAKDHNPHCHIHPVVAALFLPKITLLEDHMLRSNLAYIVKQRYEKQPIVTSTDYALFYDIISDPTDVVCSNESAVKDLHNRAKLQQTLYNSVLSLRHGRYYDCNYTNFMLAIDNCRRNVADNPDLIYEGHEGTVLQRLLGAFSLRPTIVATTPLYNTLNNNPMRHSTVMPKVQSIPMITLKLPSMYAYNNSPNLVQRVELDSALNMSQFYVEDGTVVPRNQQIIYSRGVLIFFVPRRAHTLNISKLVAPHRAMFHRLPRTVAGFDRLNDVPVNYQENLSLRNGEHSYTLKSVVIVDVNTTILQESETNGTVAPKLITGCSTVVWKTDNDQGQPEYSGEVYHYNPRQASIQNVFPDANNNNVSTAIGNSPVSWLDPNSAASLESTYDMCSTRGTIYLYKQDEVSNINHLMDPIVY